MRIGIERRWVIVIYGLGIQALTVGLNTYAFAFFVVPWMQEFSASRGELMLAVGGSAIALAIWGPLGGVLIDRFSSRRLVTAAALLFAAGLVGIAAAPGPLLIILIFSLLLPAGAVLSGPLMAQTLTARHFTERRGLALGITGLGTSFGGLLMPLLVTALLARYDWRMVFLLLAALTVVVIVLPAFVLLADKAGDVAARRTGGGTDWRLMRSPGVLALGLAYLAPVLVFVGVLHNLGAYARDLGIAQQQAAWVVSATSTVMLLSKLAVGALADRVDARRIYGALVILTCVGTAIVASASGVLALGFGLVAIGATAGGMMPLFSNLVAQRYGLENFGRVSGVVHAFAALSGLAPSIAGWIRDAGSDYGMAFYCLLLPIPPALFIFLRLMARPVPSAATAAGERLVLVDAER